MITFAAKKLSQNLDFIFGIRAIIEAIRAGKEIDKVFIQRGLSGELSQDLFQEVKENNIGFQYVPIEKLNRITRKNHQGAIAFVSPITYNNIESIIPYLFEQGKTPLILILDGVTDVRNVGAIARTAECAGVDAIIVPEKGSAQINADAVKTSAGALNYIQVCKAKSLINTIKFLKDSGLQIIAATEKTSDPYYKIDYQLPLAIILGSEDIGISADLLRIADYLVSIPLLGHIESLNVSAAASILLYEAVKQRMGNL